MPRYRDEDDDDLPACKTDHTPLLILGGIMLVVALCGASFAVGRVTKQSAMDRIIEKNEQRRVEEQEAYRKYMAEPFDAVAWKKKCDDDVKRYNNSAEQKRLEDKRGDRR